MKEKVKMGRNALQTLLFPHTVLTEGDFRHLSVMLPGISLLHVLRPPVVPEWACKKTSSLAVVREEGLLERIGLSLKGYRDFADLHGEGSALASLGVELTGGGSESRVGIQHGLKGKPPLSPDPQTRSIMEAAVFLEMARDLDERDMELERGVAEAGDLEEKFREVLGITEEDEIDEASETLSPPLTPGRTHLAFMLQQRIAFWFRLFCTLPLEAPPALLALIPEAVDEVLDPFRIEDYRAGTPAQSLQRELLTIPSLDRLKPEEFAALLADVEGSGAGRSWRSALADCLRDPRNPSFMEALDSAAGTFKRRVEDFCRDADRLDGGEIVLNAAFLQDRTFDDIWKRLDGSGREAQERGASPSGSPPALFFLG